MDVDLETRLFEETEQGRRRSVLFAIIVATGAVCISTATIALLAPPGAPAVGVVFALVGGCLLVFGGYIHRGGVPGLFEDEQLLWRL